VFVFSFRVCGFFSGSFYVLFCFASADLFLVFLFGSLGFIVGLSRFAQWQLHL